MAVLGKLALLLGFGAAGYGALHLGQTLTELRAERSQPAPEPASAARPGVAQTGAEPPAWPAVFGQPATDAPAPETPDPISQDYSLIGVVAGLQSRWAVIAAPSGEVLVRPGDVLSGGETVEKITPGGVWVRKGAERARIGFPGDEGQTVQGAPPPAAATAPRRVEIARGDLLGRDLRRVFGRAGTIQMVAAGGAPAPEILWVRAGEIYDRIGLRSGDRVLRINGEPAGAPETLARAGDIIASSPEVMLEVLRAGVIVPITVVLVGNN